MPSPWKERSRWTVLVAACWVEATSGLSYVFSTYSGVLKSELGYDQRHLNKLAVAKDLGDHIGLAAGLLCRVLPNWAVLLIGSFLILGGYGFLWLLTDHTVPALPFWLVCITMFIGTNGATYLDTAALVTCLSNFSSNRATVVGLLKGFKGLSGAIYNQLYASFLAPDKTSFILLITLGPTVVMVPLILMMGPGSAMKLAVGGDKEDLNFRLLCGASLLLAAYILTVTLVQDLSSVSNNTNIAFTIVLFIGLLLPLFVPKIAELSRKRHHKEITELENPLLGEGCVAEDGLTSRVSDANTEEQKLLGDAGNLLSPGSDHQSLSKAFRNINFWLLVFSIFFSMGSGTTAFNNLAQMAEAQGYENTEVFVSMCNIWNFMGHLVGGYVSEVSTRNYGHPRTLVLAVAQVIMATGHILFATALPKTIYVAVFLVAAGYGVEWAVFPTALSELFGLQNFGILYNFVTMASPAGSLIYSTFIAGPLYDQQAREQGSSTCEGTACFETTFFIMAAVCGIAATLSIALATRTRSFYRLC
ncbi:hypothetical protein GOP47_0024703 [Adiantum capillus-veneris]|uniref:Nodulin-like domain-containing protein n=1 Tax=Adiantum capillus-veneris TaxID=13818 RepID=A0A9D4U2K9_ADICA|nr:hypothetical protein GOP47_0024703 [Adiantum capillus-veneris]